MSSPVAIIDIGSNTIKSLVARRGKTEALEVLHSRAIEARISTGIGHEQPVLAGEGIDRAVQALRELLAEASGFSPARVVVAATSAVRDAGNREAFTGRVRDETGVEVRVLSGDEEANLIGRGLACDPGLRDLQDFYMFDLGGGSLECLLFEARRATQACSLQLGCVRLSEKFLSDPKRPLGRTGRYRIMQHVHDTLVRSPFRFSLPRDACAVGTGGTLTTVRAILGAREHKPAAEAASFMPVTQLRLLLTQLSRMTASERSAVPGLPEARADIFPAALATLIVLADVGAFPGYHHSFFNLRYGLADEALSGM